jgi:hypothetical protein
MRYLSSALLLTLLSGTVAIRATESLSKLEGSVAIVISGGSSATAASLEAMQSEVETLVRSAGIYVSWPSMEQASSQSFQRLAIITLKGQCNAKAQIPANILLNRSVPALGRTHVVDGTVLPIADIQCDALHKVIRRDLLAASESERDGLFGKAVGRVMAHELYHILLKTEQHGSTGLARPEQTSRELLRESASFAAMDESKLSTTNRESEVATESGR